MRLDVLLVERGFAPTRAQAHAVVRAGDVTVNGQREDKPGSLVRQDAEIALRPRARYVGRGAHKLAAALSAFGIDPDGRLCVDVGASTGGFTDVLLQHGARRVYAVDVGRGQLAWSLRRHPRVVCLERTDIRAVASLPEPIDLAVVDVAFISLRLVLPAVRCLLTDAGLCIALVKPQFEAGRGQVERGGLVTDAAVHRRVLTEVLTWATASGWTVAGSVRSPIAGAAGNQEFLVLLAMPGAARPDVSVADAVDTVLG